AVRARAHPRLRDVPLPLQPARRRAVLEGMPRDGDSRLAARARGAVPQGRPHLQARRRTVHCRFVGVRDDGAAHRAGDLAPHGEARTGRAQGIHDQVPRQGGRGHQCAAAARGVREAVRAGESRGVEPTVIFFLQMFLILAACRLCGWLVRRWLRQPQVIGEMIAGVILGPSLLGSLAPGIQQFLFPPESKPLLYAVAQTGIALYMFLVGLDFRSEDFKSNAPSAVAVSLSGIVVPFIVAIFATPALMQVPDLFGTGVSQFNATLFLGAAIAITAFPVLARIIHDRGLSGTLIATQALSAAAIGDAIAWCVVAVVLASLGAGSHVVMLAVGGGLALSVLLILLGPRLFAPLGRLAQREHEAGQPLSPTVLAVSLMLCTLSAYVSDAIGLHAVFGA